MKFLRPHSADSGLVTVLLVSDAELDALIYGVMCTATGQSPIAAAQDEKLALKKLHAELQTARKAL